MSESQVVRSSFTTECIPLRRRTDAPDSPGDVLPVVMSATGPAVECNSAADALKQMRRESSVAEEAADQ